MMKKMTCMDTSLKVSKKWIETTDRGGLCHITNRTYRLFEAIEHTCYPTLRNNFDQRAQRSVQTIAHKTAEDSDVQHLWSTVALDISDDELLTEIIEEWVTMRGHAIRSQTLESYKRQKKDKKKKSGKNALRKELKRSTPSEKQ